MSEANQPQVVRSYLGQLEAALDGVPAQARRAILYGAAEELAGLDAGAAAARIEQLGDPVFIAAEARAEAGVGSDATASSATENVLRRGDARWYIVLSSLLVAIGGVAVPLIGWVFGLAMVWVSKSWQLWEKWVATLTPPLAIAISVLLMGLLRGASGGEDSDGVNPLLPSTPDSLFSNLFLLVGLNAVVGIWLLWRGLRSGTSVTQRGR